MTTSLGVSPNPETQVSASMNRSLAFLGVVQVVEAVPATPQPGDAPHAELLEDLHELLAPGCEQVDQPLCPPVDVHLQHELGVGGGDAARAAAAALAAAAADAAQRHKLRRADPRAVRAERDRLHHIL